MAEVKLFVKLRLAASLHGRRSKRREWGKNERAKRVRVAKGSVANRPVSIALGTFSALFRIWSTIFTFPALLST